MVNLSARTGSVGIGPHRDGQRDGHPDGQRDGQGAPGVFAPEWLTGMIATSLEQRWADGDTHLDAICHYALTPAGKLLRPVLLLESALCVGGEASQVLPAAVGAECGHVASLIHDDIIDGDDVRRGRPSVPHQYGRDDAIVAGDALLFDLFAGLAECQGAGVAADRVVAAMAAVSRAGIDLCQGQMLEAELSEHRRFDADAYLRVARLKTASLFRGACECGAILGGASPSVSAAVAAYGENLGLAFQISDDLLCYLSDSAATGKPGASDMKNGRMTLPVIYGHERASAADRATLAELLSGRHESASALAELTSVLERSGALAAAAASAHDYVERARLSIADLPPTPSKDRLVELVCRVHRRER